ncbi:hypothetical protein TNIN_102481 [Trichonephila inaurata madagascariensis]|uniref:Uncharacterized protein n=1 Tax=Trichonephila inaurata madagascariensis TaxID=2747483 RepID=A0A8X6XC44_9ARAC|nr:hypothetical protein TNIN_102481 [Trichonephila inaurata madagascariensis]
MFGCALGVGLSTTPIPREIFDAVLTASSIKRTPCLAVLLELDYPQLLFQKVCSLCLNKIPHIEKERQRAKECLEMQATKMKLTGKSYSQASVGTAVHIPVSDVDIGRRDARYVLAAVMKNTE